MLRKLFRFKVGMLLVAFWLSIPEATLAVGISCQNDSGVRVPIFDVLKSRLVQGEFDDFIREIDATNPDGHWSEADQLKFANTLENLANGTTPECIVLERQDISAVLQIEIVGFKYPRGFIFLSLSAINSSEGWELVRAVVNSNFDKVYSLER